MGLRRTLQGARTKVAETHRHVMERRPWLNALAYRRTVRALERRKASEAGLEDVLDTVLDVQPGWTPYRVLALQHRTELEEFVGYLRRREPRTVVEIGTFLGGTLYVWTRALDSTRRVVSVDRPVWTELVHERRRELYPTFSAATDIDVVYGDSHGDATYEAVRERVDDVDLLFVDGDHSYEGVREDFETYRDLLGNDGVVALHDIERHAADRAEKRRRLERVDDLTEDLVRVGRPEWGVDEFWEELVGSYDTREFLTHPEQMGMGIGVVEL